MIHALHVAVRQADGGLVNRWDEHSLPMREIDVLWITAGLGCDGDTIAMTAAMQPSIEDVLLGGMPVDGCTHRL